MTYLTYAQAKEKVERDLDMQGEDFVDDDELMGYFNDAIDEAEAIIQELFEDYFLTSSYVALTLGESDYPMPSNIYAQKIRKVLWKDGNERYEVMPIDLEAIDGVDANDDYQYLLENNTADDGVRFTLYPDARETTSTKLRVWYIRNANRVTVEGDKIDIPEHYAYIFAYVKRMCCIKEGHPRMQFWMGEVKEQEQRMRNVLQTRKLDGNTHIKADFSFYEDFGDC